MLERMVWLPCSNSEPPACYRCLWKATGEVDTYLSQRRTGYVPCPKALWQHSWEHSALHHWTSYAPPRNFPQPYALPHAALLWYAEEGVQTVHTWIEAAVWRIQLQRHAVADVNWAVNTLPTQAWKCFAWLRAAQVHAWYGLLDPMQKRSFCMLVRHIALECGRVSREDGCFIALNYAVCDSPSSTTVSGTEVH